MANDRAIVATIRDGQWLTSDRMRLYPRIFLAIFLAGLIWLVFSPLRPSWNGSDFAGFWVPANLAALGRAPAIYDQPLSAALQQAISGRYNTYLPWVYPPTFLLFILPLGLLPYMAAFVVWMAASLTVYWATLRRLAGREGLVAALAMPGVMICIYNGHAEILLAGLFGGAMLLLDRRPWIAGLLLGLCSMKPHLFLLVPVALFAACRWRAIVSATTLILLGSAISLALFGTEVWRDFFFTVTGLGGGVVQNGAAFGTVMAKQQSAFAFGFRFGGPFLAVTLQAAAMALAAWAVAVTWANNRPLGDRAIVLCCGTLLASPYLFDYDLVLLAIPIALAARAGLETGFRPWQKSLLGALWIAPALVRTCSYYADLPATVILLGLAVAIFIVPPGRQARDAPSTVFNHPRKSTASMTA